MSMRKDVLVHDYKITNKRVKKKIIYHFSDVHLAEFDAYSDDQEKTVAIMQKQHWETARRSFAEGNGEPYIKESTKSTYEHFLNMIEVANDGDVLILTGDICDYISGANLRTINAALEHFAKPFVYVKGNHEITGEILDGICFSNINNPVQTVELEDMLIIGIDNSARDITAEQNQKLKEAIEIGKPILIAMHIPMVTERNKILTEKVSKYFLLNHENPSAGVLEFVDIIKQNAEKIIAILAGHLHFINNSEIAKDVTQYVASQGALGNINRYEIGV